MIEVHRITRTVTPTMEAVQWDTMQNADDVIGWIESLSRGPWISGYYEGDVAGPSHPETGEDWGRLVVMTQHGEVELTPSDWVAYDPTLEDFILIKAKTVATDFRVI